MADIANLQIKVDTNQVKTANKDLDALSRSSKNAEQSTKTLSSNFTALRGSLAAVGIAAFATQMIRSADALTKFSAQLKNATSSQQEFAEAFDNVKRIATTAQAPIEAVGSTYARLSNALKDLKVDQTQVADVAETVALGLKVNGASAEETASAMLQLSQSFGSGKMQGDEFRSAMESMPSLMREVAKTMGVTIGELKGLSSEGRITSEVLLKTFTNPELLAKLRQQADSMKTIGGSLTEAKNELLLFSGTIAQKLGIVDAFSFSINAGVNTLKMLNDQLQTGQTRLQSFLPAYDQYRQRMDKDYKPPTKFEFAPKLGEEGGKFNLGEYAVNSPSSQLKNAVAGLREDEPLKDLISAQQEYKRNLDIVNQAEKEGLMTASEAARYRIQLQKELTKATKETDDARKKAAEKANELEVKRLNVAIWTNEKVYELEQQKIKEREEASKKILEIEQRRADENFEEAQRMSKKTTDEWKDEFESLKDAVNGYSREMTQSFVDFALTGKASFGDMINSMLRDLLRLYAQKKIFDPLTGAISGAIDAGSSSGGGFFGFLSGFAGSLLGSSNSYGSEFSSSGDYIGGYYQDGVQIDGFRASGGSVSAGKNYIVGERGAELFTPSSSGSITPNHQLGGNVSIVINNNSQAQATATETTDARGNRRIEVTIGDMVASEIKRAGSDAYQAISNTFATRPRLVGR